MFGVAGEVPTLEILTAGFAQDFFGTLGTAGPVTICKGAAHTSKSMFCFCFCVATLLLAVAFKEAQGGTTPSATLLPLRIISQVAFLISSQKG
jgi:hypothetical protein